MLELLNQLQTWNRERNRRFLLLDGSLMIYLQLAKIAVKWRAIFFSSPVFRETKTVWIFLGQNILPKMKF